MIARQFKKEELEAYLRNDVYLHIYELGDLDDFFWNKTRWYGITRAGSLVSLALLYLAFKPPIFLGLGADEDFSHLSVLIHDLLPELPDQIYAHLSLGLEKIFEHDYDLKSYGTHLKLALRKKDCLTPYLSSEVKRLGLADMQEIQGLYQVSYPDNAFDPRVLETEQFFGVWRDEQLVSVAGIHVFSTVYRVAAIGNVTTHPAYRNQGLGKKVTAALCFSLLKHVDHIGLNVKADNWAAIEAYRTLGFEPHASYQEILITKKTLESYESIYKISE